MTSSLDVIAITAVASLVVGLATQGWALWARVRIEETRAKDNRAHAHEHGIIELRSTLVRLDERLDDIQSDVRWLRDYVLAHGPVMPSVRIEKGEEHAA